MSGEEDAQGEGQASDVLVQDADSHEMVLAGLPPEGWTTPAWYRDRDVITHLPGKSVRDTLEGVRTRIRLEHKPTGVAVTGTGRDYTIVKRVLVAELCERLQRRIDEAGEREAAERARAAAAPAGKGKR